MEKNYDNPKYNAAFDRCIDVMVQMMQKYGPQVLDKQKSEQHKDNGDSNHAA